jgi:glycine dehydrogenase subunit 1
MPSKYKPPFVHPYIPNSSPATFQSMLDTVGAAEIDDLFEAIPEHLRSGHKKLPLPEPLLAEADLWKHVRRMLKKNQHTDDYVCFLGGGVAKHYVPAVCDELVRKPEFYTSFMGFEASDAGKLQVEWEYQSMLCDLVDMGMTGWTTHCGASAGASAVLFGGRLNPDKHDAVVAGNLSPDRKSVINETCRARLNMVFVDVDPQTGLIDIDDYRSKVSKDTAVIYFENPAYLGAIETRGAEICRIAHEHGALCAVSVNPISLGLLEPPRSYGADIICGDTQPLGIHLQYGGGNCGFVACPDEERYAVQYPFVLVTATETDVPGEMGFCEPNLETTSYGLREESGDMTGTNAELWTVPVGAYLAQMGPQGMREVGETIISNAHYAKTRLATVTGVGLPLKSTPFMEVVVNFDGTGKTVGEINKALLDRGMFGGHDISREFPQFGQSALFCFTELITKQDVDNLVASLQEIVK